MVKKEDMVDVVDENIDESEEIEEVIDPFDLEALIAEGTDAILKRDIEYFSVKHNAIRRMEINIRPISHSEWERMARLTGKKDKKNIEQLICSKGWLDMDDMPIELSKIKTMEKGVVTSVYEEIKIVSGQTQDIFQDKFIQQIREGF